MRPKRTTREKAAAAAAGAGQSASHQSVEQDVQAGATNGTAASFSSAEQEEIARLAYHLWEARGGQGGSAEDDWLRAEQEYRKRREASTR